MLRTRYIRLVWWGIVCLGLIISGCALLSLWCRTGVTPEQALINAINKKPASQPVPRSKVADTKRIDPTVTAIQRWTTAAAKKNKPQRTSVVYRKPVRKKKRVRMAHGNRPRKARPVRTAGKTHPVAATLWP